jgi:pathogenesis-related protein 1
MRSFGAVAGAVAAIAVGTTAAGPVHADAWSDAVLTALNQARAQYGAAPLTWNAALYGETLQYASACRFAPSNAWGAYGQTLYAGTAGSTDIRDAVAMWMSEASRYDYNNPSYSEATGSFTQVVWKSTTQVAAAVVSCPPRTVMPTMSSPTTFVVARYTPIGNVAGQFAQNVGPHT